MTEATACFRSRCASGVVLYGLLLAFLLLGCATHRTQAYAMGTREGVLEAAHRAAARLGLEPERLDSDRFRLMAPAGHNARPIEVSLLEEQLVFSGETTTDQGYGLGPTPRVLVEATRQELGQLPERGDRAGGRSALGVVGLDLLSPVLGTVYAQLGNPYERATEWGHGISLELFLRSQLEVISLATLVTGLLTAQPFWIGYAITLAVLNRGFAILTDLRTVRLRNAAADSGYRFPEEWPIPVLETPPRPRD